jgi:P27 family predicted phage terminase small subunit
MGARGPAAKPVKEKQLAGNPGKREIDKKSAQDSAPKSLPLKPDFVDKTAADIWDITVHQMANMGVLSTIDGAMLEIYCNNFAKIRKLQKFLFENNDTYETKTATGPMIKVRPEVVILQRCQQQHLAIANQFGLSPSARTRLPDPNQGDLFKDKNPFGTLN